MNYGITVLGMLTHTHRSLCVLLGVGYGRGFLCDEWFGIEGKFRSQSDSVLGDTLFGDGKLDFARDSDKSSFA